PSRRYAYPCAQGSTLENPSFHSPVGRWPALRGPRLHVSVVLNDARASIVSAYLVLRHNAAVMRPHSAALQLVGKPRLIRSPKPCFSGLLNRSIAAEVL